MQVTKPERRRLWRLKALESIFKEMAEDLRHTLVDDETMSYAAHMALYEAGVLSTRGKIQQFHEARAEEVAKLFVHIGDSHCPETRKALWSGIVGAVMWSDNEQYAQVLFGGCSEANGIAAFEAVDAFLKKNEGRAHIYLPHVIELVRKYHDCPQSANRIMGCFLHFIARFGTSGDRKLLFASA